ncbi:MAG: PAS domain S-box protein [Pyrinomonadaceae bacterium]
MPADEKKPGLIQNWALNIRSSDLATYWLSAIVESADDAIISKTLDGIITSWNRGAERIFGYTGDEVIGKSITILIPPDHINEEPQILARLRAGQRIEHYETVRMRKDGSLLDISLTVSPIRSDDGTIIGASKIARDISEKKRIEQAMREQAEVIETVNRLGQTLVAELDLHKLVQAVIDAATEISAAQFGSVFYTVFDSTGNPSMLYAVSGAPVEEFAHFADLRSAEILTSFPNPATILIEDVSKDQRYGTNSPYFGWSDGHLQVTSYLAVPIVSRSGEIYGGLFFGHSEPGVFTSRVARIVEGLSAQASIALDNARLYEATQRARAEAEKSAHENAQLYRKAEESSQLKEEFLATISHELRTPLNAILGWTRMLRARQIGDEFSAKALDTIERNARAQAQLIEDLLDVSRIVTGKLRMDVRPTDPNSFVEAAIEALKPAAEAKGLRLRKVLDGAVLSVQGDPVRLQQVVWNLLSNAIKFTPRGGSVQVRLERVNSHLEIVVADTGQGIAPEFLPYVFDRFRQADQTTTRQHGGMGLGLAIVRHLVELHGGFVQAISPGPGAGSIFTVCLPVLAIYQPGLYIDRVHPGARELLSTPEYGDRLDGIRILVVDDEPDTRELLKTELESVGAKVILAGSAAEAFTNVTHEVPDVLISDIGMPVEDGYSLIRKLRNLPAERGGDLKAIALTAYARVEDRLQALRAGYQMHVPKPVDLAELVTVIASLVKRTS